MAGLLDDDMLSSNTYTIRPNTPGVITTTEIAHKTTALPKSLSEPSATPTYRFYRSRSLRTESSSSSVKHSSRKNVGIVIGDFTRIYPDELTLSLGERIEILSKHVDVSRNIGWWTARNSRGDTGLVPVSCVKVVTSSVSSDEDAGLSIDGVYPIEIPPEDIELLDVIGVGGFGRVHRAIYKGQEVAVKVARQTNYDTVKVISEVLAEAEKFAKLAHENVCALVGVSLINDIYLVMEYAKGGSISQVIHDNGVVVPVDIVLDWALQVADGMQYLHHEVHPCMIHRDLKSSNILLQHVIDEKSIHNNVIKITDFGLAREIEHTTRMSAAGTYPWMAPEVIKSSEFSTKSDVWSFGVVLWELLTGEKPYTGLNMYLVAYGVGSSSLKLPIHSSCPQPLAILLQECWQRSYMDRPTFKTIFSTLSNLSCNASIMRMDLEQFKSLQLAWKLEIQKCFQEHKKNESGFEEKQKDLLSKMRNQDQKVIQLQKEKLQLIDMIEKFHSELQKLSETEQRPPRIEPFSFRRMIRKIMVSNKDARLKSTSKAESLAKEIERKMKDIDVTEDLLAKYSQSTAAQKRTSLPVPSGLSHSRQPSDSALGTGLRASPTLGPQRSGSLNSKSPAAEYRQTPPLQVKNPPTDSKQSLLTAAPPRRHNSYDNIIPAELSRERSLSQFDSGKHSFTSSSGNFSGYSNEAVANLIDFDHVATRPNIIADLDPLHQPVMPHVGHNVVPTSHDSLFSETISPIGVGGVRGFSPPPPTKSQVNVSPRSSATDMMSHPRTRPNSSQDSTSAPTSRPGTPKLRPQSISPSGSVQSLPPYPITSSSDVSYFASDSIDLDDIDLFDPAGKLMNFNPYN